MLSDPTTLALLSAGLSALAALFAALAAFRARPADPFLADAVTDLGRDLATLQGAIAEEMRRGRTESAGGARDLRAEIGAAVTRLGETNERRLGEMRRGAEEGGKALREEVVRQLGAVAALLGDRLDVAALATTQRLDSGAAAQKERLDGVEQSIRRLVQTSGDAHETLRKAVEGRLELMRTDNAAKLDEMRRTVDEKLQGTLEERLGEKFKTVSDHLERVHRSVGEMQNLASGVDGLKRVLTNVKTRGTWAEVSLGNLLEQVLTADQFERNVETVPGTRERVEYAVRFPGPQDGNTVWLPIDAKFPVEDYERLQEASERGDPAAVEAALRGLEIRIKGEGQKICSKYVAAPYTTDFGIMYLPTEGLYAEVIRRPGLVDHLQGQCRIVVAGPTVLMAILNSLRMGFRTLAIQQRSSEIGQTLSAVKTEFAKYGDVMDKVKKKLAEATNHVESVSTRSRAVQKQLSGIGTMADAEAARILASDMTGTLDALDAAE